VVARNFFGIRKAYPTLEEMEAYFDEDSTEVESDEEWVGPTFSIVSSPVSSPVAEDADDFEDDSDLTGIPDLDLTLSG
jgi:hypothetical protein